MNDVAALSRKMADEVGHGMTEKTDRFAEIAVAHFKPFLEAAERDKAEARNNALEEAAKAAETATVDREGANDPDKIVARTQRYVATAIRALKQQATS